MELSELLDVAILAGVWLLLGVGMMVAAHLFARKK